jgi:hypothetical protein
MEINKNTTEDELRKNIDSLTSEDWIKIIQELFLSDKFMRENIDIFDKYNLWTLLSEYQLFTMSFLNDYCLKIDWSVAQSKRVSCEMLDTIKNLPMRKKILVKIEGDLSYFTDEQLQVIWDGLKYNEMCAKTNKNPINIMQYANPNYTAQEMEEIRLDLIDEANKQSLDDLIAGTSTEEVKEEKIKKRKERNLHTKFGEIKLVAKDVYEYPMKEKRNFENSDNEFGDFVVFD